MAHALVIDNVPTELVQGMPFRGADGSWHPAEMLTPLASDAERAAIFVKEIGEVPTPAGQRLVPGQLVMVGTVPMRVFEDIPLVDLKVIRLTDAANVYAEKLAVGYPETLGGNAETLQCRNEHDRTNWLGLLIGAQTACAMTLGAENYPLKIRCTSNAEYTVTNDAAVLLMMGLLSWAGATMAAYWAVKDLITEAANTPTLNAVDIEAGYP